MLFTTHALTGAAVGVAVGNPVGGLLLGIASHHVLDSFPHFDQGSFVIKRTMPYYLGAAHEDTSHASFTKRDWLILAADMSLAGVIFAFIYASFPMTSWLVITAGALGGLLPDIVDTSPLWAEKLREKFPLVRTYHKFHDFFHWTVPIQHVFLGMITQIVVIAGVLYYLFGLR